MTFRLGLTGGIGMGKSTTAQIFRDLGHPVWDADQAVHILYGPDGAAVGPVTAAFPAAASANQIDRKVLRDVIATDPSALNVLESIVHPMVAADRRAFVLRHAKDLMVVLDVPLLFETGYQDQVDGIAVVSTDAETQRRRIMARPGMTEDLLELILLRQMPDKDKRLRADWIIPTDTLETALLAVVRILKEIESRA